MAVDVGRIRRRLPAPPADAVPALEAPPAATAADVPKAAKAASRKKASPGKTKAAARRRPAAPVQQEEDERLDGRSLRATGRTVQLNVRVAPETKEAFIELARARGELMADLFEEAIELLVKRGERDD